MISLLLQLAFFASVGFSLVAILWFSHRMSITCGCAYAWSCLGFCGALGILATLALVERIFE